MKFTKKTIAVMGLILIFVCTIIFVALVARKLLITPGPVSVTTASKITAKQIARKIKTFIYYEATIHNPPGDNLPDAWDDIILGKIKQWL